MTTPLGTPPSTRSSAGSSAGSSARSSTEAPVESSGSTSAFDKLVYRSRLCRKATRAAAQAQQVALEHRAVDVTVTAAQRSCLVLAPHPDDETLGAGATIARKRAAGTPVRIVVVADGRHANPSRIIDEAELARIRQEEAVAACGVLGVDTEHLRFAGFEDGTLDRQVETVASLLRAELAEHRPAEVLVPSAIDGHPDHRALRSALRLALADIEPQPGPVVLEYPVWFWDAKAWLDREAPAVRKIAQLLWRPLNATVHLRPRTVRTEVYLGVKRAAFDRYRSQLTNLTGEPSWPVMDPAFLEQFFRPCELFFAPPNGR